MLEKYCNKNKINFEYLENTDHILVLRIASNATKFNFLNGMHKLVRVSPFGKGDKTHTSLCKVSIDSPKEKYKVQIDEKDVRMEFFKSTGPGGQHRNKVMSAVRLVHIPTNTIVTSDGERSQHDNRKYAYERLNCKLEELYLEKQKFDKEVSRHKSLQKEDSIISYYFNHNFVVNEKKGIKTSKLKQILNGEIELLE